MSNVSDRHPAPLESAPAGAPDQTSSIALPPQEKSGSARMWQRVLGQRALVVWSIVLLLIVLSALLAPWISPYDPNIGVMSDTNAAPSAAHWLGTDSFGRDVLSRLLVGGQMALLAGLEAAGIALIVGVPLGLVVGYLGGWVDKVSMRVVDAIMAVPFLVLAIAVIAAIGPGLGKSMAVVGFVYATILMRLVRGEVLSAKEELYVEGLKVTGAGNARLLFRHILPNIAPPIIVQVTLMFATAIIAEATLSYLGLGVPSPTASWGSMLSEAQTVLRQNFFLSIPPGLAILVTVLAINQIGDGLRDLFGREIKVGKLGLNVVHRAAPRGDAPSGSVQTVAAEVSPATTPPALSVRGLSVSFPQPPSGRVEVVQDVALTLQRGEILGLVGESGSGKSVTAMSMLGLVAHPGEVHAETITLAGEEISGLDFDALRAIRGRRIGVVYQDALGSLNPTYTVGNQVMEAIREHIDISADEARQRTIELFEQVGIPNPAGRLNDYPYQFSGGMAQRVMIAMALSCDPAVIVADEPTTALDVTVQKQILDLLVRLRDERGLAVLLITHDLGVVTSVADRVAVMYAGQIVENGAVSEVFANPRHPYTQGLLDSVPRNMRAVGRLSSIPGVVPQPANWPAGCHFADRCAFVTEACRETPVALRSIDVVRTVRCIRAEEIELGGIATLSDLDPDLDPDLRRRAS